MSQDSPDLSSLLSRVALHDRQAFERLYRATCAHLFSVAFRILRNEQRADEVLQEAFMNIWHHAAAYRPAQGTPMTWMINIVRNKAIDTLRSGKAERAATTELDEQALEVADDTVRGPQEQFDESLARARIDACMAGLQASQRQALALAYYRGMVHTEIAATLNTPLGTVKGWVRRGLDQLRSCLEAAGGRP